MAVIGIPVNMLLQRIKTPLSRDELVSTLQQLGCDVEGYATLRRFRCQRCDNFMEITETEHPPVVCDRCGADYRAHASLLHEAGSSEVVRMELLAVRPDMFEPGGLARALRHYLSEQLQSANYPLSAPKWTVTVDAALSKPQSLRPAIACAILRNITLNDDLIKVIMKLQENLHWALGRDRKRASIGVYDLDRITGPQLTYRAIAPDGLRFVPLGYDVNDAAAAITPAQVLQHHTKGVAYAKLLSGFTHYPLLCDGAGQVMSMPPIINSEATRVTHQTRNFFIDVTGLEPRIVDKTLNMMVTSLLELDQNAQLEAVTIQHVDNARQTPDLTPQRVVVSTREAAQTIGLDLTQGTLSTLLSRMGHNLNALSGDDKNAGNEKNDQLEVLVPAYRNDILHPIDLIEDAAIAYGYDRIEPQLVPTLTIAQEHPLQTRAQLCRTILTSLGYFEVMTLMLSNVAQQYEALGLCESADAVLIENPISSEQTQLRTALLPGLLDTLSVNTDHPLPQRIFEVGKVSHLAPNDETGARETLRLAGAAIGPHVDYSMMRAVAEAVCRELTIPMTIEALTDAEATQNAPYFIAGRGAAMWATVGQTRTRIGLLGELHPSVLETIGLMHPVASFELHIL